MVQTTKIMLVTVIAAYELQDRLKHDLGALGVKGYSVGKVDGLGVHGPRTVGLADAPNQRIEMLVHAPLAQKILHQVTSHYQGQAIIAYMHPVEAVPHEQFA